MTRTRLIIVLAFIFFLVGPTLLFIAVQLARGKSIFQFKRTGDKSVITDIKRINVPEILTTLSEKSVFTRQTILVGFGLMGGLAVLGALIFAGYYLYTLYITVPEPLFPVESHGLKAGPDGTEEQGRNGSVSNETSFWNPAGISMVAVGSLVIVVVIIVCLCKFTPRPTSPTDLGPPRKSSVAASTVSSNGQDPKDPETRLTDELGDALPITVLPTVLSGQEQKLETARSTEVLTPPTVSPATTAQQEAMDNEMTIFSNAFNKVSKKMAAAKGTIPETQQDSVFSIVGNFFTNNDSITKRESYAALYKNIMQDNVPSVIGIPPYPESGKSGWTFTSDDILEDRPAIRLKSNSTMMHVCCAINYRVQATDESIWILVKLDPEDTKVVDLSFERDDSSGRPAFRPEDRWGVISLEQFMDLDPRLSAEWIAMLTSETADAKELLNIGSI
jgi:hypothetical protein